MRMEYKLHGNIKQLAWMLKKANIKSKANKLINLHPMGVDSDKNNKTYENVKIYENGKICEDYKIYKNHSTIKTLIFVLSLFRDCL